MGLDLEWLKQGGQPFENLTLICLNFVQILAKPLKNTFFYKNLPKFTKCVAKPENYAKTLRAAAPGPQGRPRSRVYGWSGQRQPQSSELPTSRQDEDPNRAELCARVPGTRPLPGDPERTWTPSLRWGHILIVLHPWRDAPCMLKAKTQPVRWLALAALQRIGPGPGNPGPGTRGPSSSGMSTREQASQV